MRPDPGAVVNDVRKDDFDQVGAAYRELFEAAGGGALGLFTAISAPARGAWAHRPARWN